MHHISAPTALLVVWSEEAYSARMAPQLTPEQRKLSLLSEVRQDGKAIQFGPAELKADREVVIAAVSNSKLCKEPAVKCFVLLLKKINDLGIILVWRSPYESNNQLSYGNHLNQDFNL